MASSTSTSDASPRSRLAACRAEVQAIILSRQDPHSGLLPASTAVTVHGDYTHAWVRDNVYSILAVWALALASRRADPAAAPALEDAVVRLMRGLLGAMIRQAPKVERFKHTQHPLDALHAKYDTATGESVVGDADWGHLQIDATALFVLWLVRMSSGGLAIVRTDAELAFVQNLVHYLAKAYRTPDYGIWERGHKRNEGLAEINASSVGMAKAALEAVHGFHFLPPPAPAVHVVADDIAHARDALDSLLPRESLSKETDAALLSVVGFPAYAVEDPALAARTRGLIVSKLEGRYGCKRFLRDGHQTALEDHARLHYEPGELQQFEHIESEWPLFFTYLMLDAQLRGEHETAMSYRSRLQPLLQSRDGLALLPELYRVPADAVEAERANPGSQDREPNENLPLVWAQSLYIVGQLLLDGDVDAGALCPPPPTAPPKLSPLHVVVLAENVVIRSRLAAHGINAEMADGGSPIEVHGVDALIAAFGELGRHDALGLSGRPAHRLGCLATGSGYAVGQRRMVFLPAFLGRPRFYLTLDNRLLVDEIAAEAAYLRRHWRRPGRPMLLLQITEPMLESPGVDRLLAYLLALHDGLHQGVTVVPLDKAWASGEVTTIDWLADLPGGQTALAMPSGLGAALEWDEAATRPLTAARAALLEHETDSGALMAQLSGSRNPYEQIELLSLLWGRHGPQMQLQLGGSARDMVAAVYAHASRLRLWGVLRRAAALLELVDETVEHAMAHLVVHQRRVLLGREAHPEATVSRPCSHLDIAERLRRFGGDDLRARLLIQEAVLLLGTLVKAEPALFKDTLTLRPWQLVLLVNGWLAREHGITPAEAFDHLLGLSPSAILGRLREVIAREQEMQNNLLGLQLLRCLPGPSPLQDVRFTAENDPPLAGVEGGWRAWREATGVMTRAQGDFHAHVRTLMQHCEGIVVGEPLDARNRLDSATLLADTTPDEPAFAHGVEDLLDKIEDAAYRQLTIEALSAAAVFCAANPGLKINGQLVADTLLATAVACATGDAQAAEHVAAGVATGVAAGVDGPEGGWAEAWQDFYASPPHRVAGFVIDAFKLLLRRTAA